MKKIIWSIVTVILVVVSILIVVSVIKSNKSAKAETIINDKSQKILPVNFIIIQPELLDNKIVLNGNLLSNEEVEIRSEITGKIVSIHFKEGSNVSKGALLVKINDDELLAQKKKLQFRKNLASDNEYRQKALFDKNSISKETYDIAYNELQVINSELELIDAQIKKTEISAPFGGIIGLRSVSVGSYVTPSTKIAFLQSVDPIKVEFGVPQKYQSQIKTNQEINISSSSAEPFQGKVYATESKLDEASRSLTVRALIANSKNKLRPGEYVTVNVPVNKVGKTIMIPSMTLVPDIKGETVFLYHSGKAAQVVVSPGNRTADNVEILSGLKYGDTLITSGIIQLRNNLPVKLKETND